MDQQGWETHLALFSYRRYRKKTLAIVLGGPLPTGMKIHKFWTETMSPVERAARFVLAGTKFVMRRALRKPVKKIVIEDRGAYTHEWQFDPLERLLLEVDRRKDTEQVTNRTWYDTNGKWLLKEWLGKDEDDPLAIQRPTDPEPVPMADARAQWLLTLGLPVGTVAMADSPYSYPAIAQLPDTFGRIFVFHLQHLTYGQEAKGELTKRMGAHFEPIAWRADSVAVSTPDQADDLLERFGSNYPVDFVSPVVRIVESDPNLPRDPRKIVSIGRLVDIKRIHLAIDAMPMVLEKVPDAYLEIWGSGIERDLIAEHIKATGMSKHVKLMGYTPNPEKVFRSAACSVLTSRREAFGLVVIESMLQGCPVVAFDVKYGPGRIIRDGENGFIVKDKDIAGIAEGIVKILTNPELQSSMVKESEKIRSLVDHDRYQEEWNELGLKIRQIALDRSTSK